MREVTGDKAEIQRIGELYGDCNIDLSHVPDRDLVWELMKRGGVRTFWAGLHDHYEFWSNRREFHGEGPAIVFEVRN